MVTGYDLFKDKAMRNIQNFLTKALEASEEAVKKQKKALEEFKENEESKLRERYSEIKILYESDQTITKSDIKKFTIDNIVVNNFNKEILESMNRIVDSPTDSKAKGAMIYGPVGTGKTHIAKAFMMRMILERDMSARYYSLNDLIDKFRPKEGQEPFNKAEVINTDILCIDDVGAEKTTEFVESELLGIVDKRSSRDKITFITSNYSLAAMKEVYGIRIPDRIQEYLAVFECDGNSYRRTKALEINNEVRKGT